MENIVIIDNFFSQENYNKICSYFKITNYDCNSIHRPNIDETSDKPFWRLELSNVAFFNDYLKKIIENKFKKNFIVKRVYAVGQNYEQNSNYHPDEREINNTCYTFCYYINENITENDDGYFYIKIPNKKYILGIEPLHNRGIYFNSNYIHKGTGYNRFSNELRICIAWKLKEII